MSREEQQRKNLGEGREESASGAVAMGGEKLASSAAGIRGLMALLILVGVWVSERRAESVTCTPEMKAFFDEFSQYDGGQWRPTPTGRYCGIHVGTSGSEEEVFAYYSEKLRENGWQVAILEFPDSSEPTDAENRTLVGRKEGIYYYEVNYEPPGDRKRSSTEPFIRVDVT